MAPTEEEQTRRPPLTCPPDYQKGVDLWDPEPRALLTSHGIPFMIIAAIADDGYHTMADIADRYTDMADTKTHAPTDYRFSHALCNAYADKDTIFAAMRLGQVVKAAQQVRKDRLTALTETANINVATLGSQQARDSLEHAYKVRCGRLPAGRMQGTDLSLIHI